MTDSPPDADPDLAPDEPTPAPQPFDDDRYANLHLADHGAVIYDRENPNAWIRSSDPTSLDASV